MSWKIIKSQKQKQKRHLYQSIFEIKEKWRMKRMIWKSTDCTRTTSNLMAKKEIKLKWNDSIEIQNVNYLDQTRFDL